MSLMNACRIMERASRQPFETCEGPTHFERYREARRQATTMVRSVDCTLVQPMGSSVGDIL